MKRDRSGSYLNVLLLDLDGVERWTCLVLRGGKAPTSCLVNIATRLRTQADLIADYLFRNSKPVKPRTGARLRPQGHTAPRGGLAASGAKQGQGCDSGGRPQGVPSGSKRSVPVAPTSTNQGQLVTLSEKGSTTN